MSVDVLVLNSGTWVLTDELPAEPWWILIYRLRHDPRNELHAWLPPAADGPAEDFAFRRYWHEEEVRWCVEAPPDPDRLRTVTGAADGTLRIRFSASDGLVLWAGYRGVGRLADFTHEELRTLRHQARPGPYSRI